MPASETMCMSFGSWIAAFPVVYAITGVATLAALVIVANWGADILRRGRVVAKGKLIGRTSIAESRA